MPKLLSEEDKQKIEDRLNFLDNQIKIKSKELSKLRQERTKLKLRTNWYRKYSPKAKEKLCRK